MKYIRTKDGRIFKNYDNLQIIDNTLCNMQNGKVWLILGKIIKQADTIEELCDEFVGDIPVDDKQNSYIPRAIKIVDRIADFSVIDRQMFKNKIYGAIWTDKGLIYIAKMNDKGEWELL